MSLLNVGARALQVNQTAIQTAGHNIANVNTEGYSRQTVSLRTMPSHSTIDGYIGTGVDVDGILRNHSELLTRQASAAASVQAGDAVRLDRLKQLQDVFTGGTSGLGAAINDMMNALSDVVNAPNDLTARGVVLTRMDETAKRMRDASGRMDEIAATVDYQTQNGVNVVNNLAKDMAEVNRQITLARGKGQQANDLLDRRDQLIRDINQYVQTSQVAADDGSVTLFVANSQPLVMGDRAGSLSIGDPQNFNTNGAQKKLLFTPAGSTQKIELNEAVLGGGEVSALMRFQNNDLAEGRNLLGRLAVSISETLNLQNRQGLTLDGALGENLFTPIALGNAVNGQRNANPDLTMGLEVVDPSKLQPSNYVVRFVGGGGTVTRQADGKVFSFTDNDDLNTLMLGQGLKLTNGAAAPDTEAFEGASDGDQFLINPLQNAANQMQAARFSPRDLAAANAINAAMGPSNDGSLQLVSLKATGNPALTLPPTGTGVTLTFNATASPTTFTLTGNTASPVDTSTNPPTPLTAPFTYTPGQTISVDGWEITLNGMPKTGDTVVVGNAKDPQYGDIYVRDAGNAKALMNLRDAKIFDGGSLTDGFAGAMAQIGTRTQSAQFAAQLSTTIAGNLENERAAVSGVNLDEEAARLIQYQQAYQASAKMIQIAQNIFDNLIQTVGR
ncbi:MAG: flagellar hook-associated protein FlgK [Giesbergeria sp.]|uniref:flagellar hook-associated protein FlgK n=1 Tax=Giesbergeria sp. TaxID=2818473 RepID=UPI00262821B8|nr:flagellar hook-associated protein FlgK [Giesbergeria sp.]MDD2608136.1 flagellar hook-associated protein FlgK [Giesbergeria sp.]